MFEPIDQIVQELLDLHVGGVTFFDHLDATWRTPAGWPVVRELLGRALIQQYSSSSGPFEKKFPGATPISTGRFGMYLTNAFSVDLILVTGGLRTTAPMDDLWWLRQKHERRLSQDFILLDDSFYSGKTRGLIRAELERQGGRLVHSYIIYDGSWERDPEVTSLYRYYDHFASGSSKANSYGRAGSRLTYGSV